jgi:hypothetical protein
LLTSITTFVHLLVIGWLPGAAIFRLPFAERDKRAALDAEERLFWAVMLSVAISAAVVVALAVVNRYTFERLLLADAGIAAAAALVGRFDLRLGSAARRAGLTAIVPLVLVLLAAWRFFPPAEYVMGGKDPGTYVNGAARSSTTTPSSPRCRRSRAICSSPRTCATTITAFASWGSGSRTPTPAVSPVSFRTSFRPRSRLATASTV